MDSPDVVYGPYLAARKEWTERYGDHISRARNWRGMAFLVGVFAVFSVGLNIYQVTRDQFRAYPVLIDDRGNTIAAGLAPQLSPLQLDRVKRATLEDFIRNLRSVTTDGVAQRHYIESAYAHIAKGSAAQAFVNEFYAARPPFERAEEETVTVQVHSVLPIGDKTLQVEWTEVARDKQGATHAATRWRASVGTAVSPPQDEVTARANPLGLYATSISWSEVVEK